jgi:uncharacterized protein (UPF0335 family)
MSNELENEVKRCDQLNINKFVVEIEKIEREKDDLADLLIDKYKEFKVWGGNCQALKEVIKRRKKDKQDVEDMDNLISNYEEVLNGVVSEVKEDEKVS